MLFGEIALRNNHYYYYYYLITVVFCSIVGVFYQRLVLLCSGLFNYSCVLLYCWSFFTRDWCYCVLVYLITVVFCSLVGVFGAKIYVTVFWFI